MTEYSDKLPTESKEETEVLDTVETLDTPVQDLNPAEPTPDLAPKQDESLDPFANIFNTTPTDDKVATENNKFFNQLEDEPASLDNLSSFSSESVFNIDNTPATEEKPTDSNIEIFDVAPEKTETPVEEPTPSVDPFAESSIVDELNPNNKFFQPIKEQPETQTMAEEKIEDQLINPMNFVDELETPKAEPTPSSNGYETAVSDIKDLVEGLKIQGLNVSIDETDIENKHQIIIQIEK